jgi:hypothetical protein
MTSRNGNLDISDDVLAKLADMRRRPKYVEMPSGGPFGGVRSMAEAQLNDLIDRLKDGLPRNPTKRFALDEFKRTMNEFQSSDTEDREQFLHYLEEIMTILSIESSDGLLNKWMYGSILGRLIGR